MDLRQFLQILKKYSLFIIVLAVLGAVVGFLSTSITASGFQRTQTYIVISGESQDPQNSSNSQTETYYVGENLRNSTDTIVAILQSDDFQKEVLDLGDSLQVKKIAPQVIRLTYTSPVEQNSAQNLDRVVANFNGLIGNLTKANLAIQLKPVGIVSTPTFSKVNTLILLIAGFLVGTAFAIFIVSLKEYNNL